MVARIVIGILLGYVLIAYYPLILQFLPYLWPIILMGVAFFALRALPALSEPLGYGLLVALLCYIAYLILRHRGNLKTFIEKARKQHKHLPVINIPHHPQLSVLITLTTYTLGLTFVLYLLILLIYVQ